MPTTKASKKKVKKKGRKAAAKNVALDPAMVPWDSQLDDDALVGAGGALLAMLSGRARQLGHNRKELAHHLDVTYGYIAQLSSGQREMRHISDKFAERCARYLGVPRMTILLAAGVITANDLYEKPDDILTSLPRAMAYIEEDPVYGHLVPPELLGGEASPKLQLLVVKLFEAARGIKLIPGEHTLDEIVASVNHIQERRRRLLEEARRVSRRAGAPRRGRRKKKKVAA